MTSRPDSVGFLHQSENDGRPRSANSLPPERQDWKTDPTEQPKNTYDVYEHFYRL